MMTLYSRLTLVSVVAVIANEVTKTTGFIEFNVPIKDDSQVFVPGYRLFISAYHPEMVIRL